MLLFDLNTFVVTVFENDTQNELVKQRRKLEKKMDKFASGSWLPHLLNLGAKLRQLHALRVVEHFHQKLRMQYTLNVSNGLVKSDVGFTSPETMGNEQVSTCSFQASTHTLKLMDRIGTV